MISHDGWSWWTLHVMHVKYHELQPLHAMIQDIPPLPTAMLVVFSCRLSFAQHNLCTLHYGGDNYNLLYAIHKLYTWREEHDIQCWIETLLGVYTYRLVLLHTEAGSSSMSYCDSMCAWAYNNYMGQLFGQ